MSSADRIGLELAPHIIRGVRVGKSTRSVSRKVEPGHEVQTLHDLLKELGSPNRTSIRIVLRGVPLATTRLLPLPPEAVTSVSEYIPIPIREAAWEALPFGEEDRTILLGAGRRSIEEALDTWGITPTSHIAPDAVGLTTPALLALESELSGDGDMLWTECLGTEHARALLFKRSGGKFIDVGFRAADEPAKFIVGAGALEHARTNTGAIAFRPGNFDPEFAIAYGATRWGTADFPVMPNLEPKDRREYRRKNEEARRARKIALAASLAIVALAGAIQIPIVFAAKASAEARAQAEARKTSAESEWNRACEELAKRIPPDRGPEEAIESVLSVASSFKAQVYITQLRSEPATIVYAGLPSAERGASSSIILIGRAETLESVESLRASLQNAGHHATVEEENKTERPAFAIDFRMSIR